MVETQQALPQYQCHKKVWAMKIVDIKGNELSFEDSAMPLVVSDQYLNKHKPQVGGYWVRYEDGYESWSPAEAFESGYTLIT